MKTILVVEDNDLMRKNIVEMLEIAGYDVEAVVDEHKLADLVSAIQPNLVICHLTLQGLDAIKNIPSIFFTSKPGLPGFSEEDVTKHNCLPKPFSSKELLQAVENVFRGGV